MKRSILFGATAASAAIAYALFRDRTLMDLTGKVVLITGGSRGLGLALAREFAARGSHLVLCARNTAELERARRDLATAGGRILTVPCDVTDRKQVADFIRAAVHEFGRIDVVVNNAGLISVGPLEAMSIDDFEQAMDVMFWGVVYTTLEALPHLRRQGSGHVVNITSIGGKVSIPHLLPYSCAKFAAVAFSEGLRAELQKTGVNVLTIAPGLMRTGSHLNALFKGNKRAEPVWFSLGATLPGISMSAKRAAGQIVEAIEQGRSERILSTPANLLARFHALFPELSGAVLGFANQLLPNGTQHQTEAGKDTEVLKRPWMRALTVLGRHAADDYLQVGESVRV